jgi:putative aminopeptidase FrvX
MHSVVECADLSDIEHVVSLLAAFVLSIKPGDSFAQTL